MSTNMKIKSTSEREQTLAKSRLIVDGAKAAGRGLTPDEKSAVQGHLNAIDEWDARVAADAAMLDSLDNLGTKSGAQQKSGETVFGHGYQSFDGTPRTKGAGDAFVKGAVETMGRVAENFGVKALLAGQVTVPAVVDVVQLPETPTVLLDLVARQALHEHTFAYMRQTLRDEKAAVVADGQTKPTSLYSFTEVIDRARVVAHLSEPFPIRFMADHEAMVNVLNAEMKGGVMRALEKEILQGDGTGEHFTGLLNVEGVRRVPFATDMVTTIRKAITASQKIGIEPTAWALSPDDAEKLDLTREGAEGGFLLGGDAKDRLGSAGPIKWVVCPSLPAGPAVLGNWGSAKLMVREETTLQADGSGVLFDTNQVKLRAEGRFGFAVTRPEAFAVVS